MQTIVTKFLGLCEDGSSVQAKLRREAADEDNVDDFFIDHRKLNLAMLMVTLYSFGMLHYGLMCVETLAGTKFVVNSPVWFQSLMFTHCNVPVGILDMMFAICSLRSFRRRASKCC